jgi:hypothetical protein
MCESSLVEFCCDLLKFGSAIDLRANRALQFKFHLGVRAQINGFLAHFILQLED